MKQLKNRYEFVYLFDVTNGNPNGDPDAGNMPRVDAETSYGIVTDVCLKRKVRNYVDLVKNSEPGYKIYIQQDEPLNALQEQAYIQCNLNEDNVKSRDKVKISQEFMCKNYYDVRTFGAVMATGDHSCGIVRGPVQINFARSVDPVFQQEVTITRMAVTNAADFERKTNEMGRKHVIPYGLFRVEGYISAALAQKVGFTEEDLDLFWQALINMFENDHSSARGKIAVQKLFIFKHNSILGDVPSNKLFDLISVSRKNVMNPPRSFDDYLVSIDDSPYQNQVEIIEKL